MKAYHGTSSENKISILNEGFRLETEFHMCKLFGDAIYFTTRKEQAKDYGSAIIEVVIEADNFMFIHEEDEFDDLFNHFAKVALHPFNSMNEFLIEQLKAIKQENKVLTSHEVLKLAEPIIKKAGYRVGTAIRTSLISKGYNGLAILMADEDIDYFELTVYDEKLIKILL